MGADQISPELEKKAMELFEKMDFDESNTIEIKEGLRHWQENFPKINTEALFKELDKNGDNKITIEEWKQFWCYLLQLGYEEKELIESIDKMIKKGNMMRVKTKVQK